MPKIDVIVDVEGNDLTPTVDRIWVIVVRQLGTGYSKPFYDAASFRKAIPRFGKVIGHNLTGYDLAAIRKVYDIPFTIGGKVDTWDGHEVEFVDTLHLSQLLNVDREGGHSLEAWGKRVGLEKIDHTDFSKLTPEMVTYCDRDTQITERVYQRLLEEAKERMI